MQLKMLVLVTVVVGVSAAASPAAALAAAPQPFTDFADVTGAATATLRGDVAPGGESTTIHFEYAPSADSFCVNGTGPRSSTTPEGIGAGAASILVSAAIGGLTPGQEYCFEVVAVNASAPGGERGGTVTFTSGAPDIFIDRVRSTAATALSVSGFVNPRAQSTNVVAEYAHSGTTFCDNNGTAGTHSTTGAVNVPAGTAEVAVSVPITSGLTAGQPYCARLVATAGGTRATSVSEITVGLPEVQSGDADGNGPTSEIIRATVWTSGQATTAHFEYGDASDPAPDSFCNSGGLTGAFTSTAGQSVPAGQVDAQVTATISGLTIGRDYCYRVAAQNASGTATDFQGFFTAGAPAVTTLPATGVTATGATFSANVNPEGLDTSVSVEWGTASGAWCASSGASGFSDGDRFADAGAGSAALDVVLPPAPLQPSTAYCYRAVAGNGRGTSAGAFLQLTTPAAPAGGGGGGGGGGGTGSGGTGAGGTGGAGGAANTIGTGATSNTFGPFDALGLPKLEYDPKFKQVSFSISSSAKGKLVAKLIFKKGSKKQVVGQLTKTLDGKAAAFVVPFNALGKRLFKKAKLAKLTLVVTITPTGKKAIVKQGTFTLKRGVGPCGGTRKASAAGGSAHMAC